MIARDVRKLVSVALLIGVAASTTRHASADETDAKVLDLVVETAVFVDECGDQFPVAKYRLDAAFSRWVVLRLSIPGLAEALRRDSPERRRLEAAIRPYFKRIPGYEKDIECSGRYEVLLLPKPTLRGDAAQVPSNVLDRYGPPGTNAVQVTAKARTTPIPPQRPPYTISLDADRGERCEARVAIGDHNFRGPDSTYGPMTEELAPATTLTWKCAQAETKTKTLELTHGVPPAFQRIRIRFSAARDPVVTFELKDRGRESRIPYGETPDEATKRQMSEALWWAANFGRLDEVRELLDKGANIDYALDDIYPSVLRVSFNARKLEVVDYLLSRGAKMRKHDWREPLLAERAMAAGQKPE